MVREQCVKQVPYTVCKPVCYEKTINTVACVAKQVPYTVTRCVPRVVCKEVPVQVCCPMPRCPTPCCKPCKKCCPTPCCDAPQAAAAGCGG
jgi:hypothetical protein